MAPACRGRADRFARQRRHVVGGGGASRGADRVRRQPRHRLAGLHHDHARIRFRRGADRQDHRPLRHRHRHRARHRHFGPGLCRRGDVILDLAIHPGAFRDRAVLVGHLRAADGGGLALVRPLPRARGRHRRQRQLYRRRDLAAADQPRHRDDGLAQHPYRDRHLHGGGDDAGADRLADADGGGGAARPSRTRRRRASIYAFPPMR